MTGDTGTQQARTDGIDSPALGLAIVSDALTETIRNAHLALEDCVDGRGGSAPLLRAAELLHQARGALQMTETYGAALLAEEMELCCSYLTTLQPCKGREDGLDALTRSMVQLPIYIERLLSGGRDIALVLLPMLNDLRAARGEPLLSESTLLQLNLSPKTGDRTAKVRTGDGEEPVKVAIRLRPKFQLALLGWVQGGDADNRIETLSQIAAALESASTRDDMYQLWWIVGGVLESLKNGGLETSEAIKRLLGQTDRQIKYLINEGVEAFDNHPIDDLLNSLLYYIARSSTAGPRVTAIRAAFNLAKLLPDDEQVQRARDVLSDERHYYQMFGLSARSPQALNTALKHAIESMHRTLYAPSASELTSSELALLKKAGVDLVEHADRDDPMLDYATEFAAILTTSLTAAEAAKRLHDVTAVWIRQKIRDGSLYGIRIDGRWKIPAFQFERKSLVPNISTVNAIIPRTLDAVSVQRFYTTPDPELETPAGELVSPLDWLKAGLNPAPVVALARDL